MSSGLDEWNIFSIVCFFQCFLREFIFSPDVLHRVLYHCLVYLQPVWHAAAAKVEGSPHVRLLEVVPASKLGPFQGLFGFVSNWQFCRWMMWYGSPLFSKSLLRVSCTGTKKIILPPAVLLRFFFESFFFKKNPGPFSRLRDKGGGKDAGLVPVTQQPTASRGRGRK